MYPCTKVYYRATYYYLVIDKTYSSLQLFVVVYKLVIHVLSCTLILGESLMVTGFIVIMLYQSVGRRSM